MREPEQLVLNQREQEALTGVLLTMWSRDIDADDDRDRKKARSARRNRLRFARRDVVPDGRPRQEPTDLEDSAHLNTLLREVRSEAHALELLITACASQPWATMNEKWSGRLDEDLRRETLAGFADTLPGSMDDETIGRIDALVSPGLLRRVARGVARRPFKTGAVVGGAVIVGVASAGVAAPAIGTAVGAQMGLAGAAATNAGLAAIGGGSLASGGLGMAGGTTLIGALGGLGGGGLGAAVGAGSAARDFEAEGGQLEALVRVGGTLSDPTKLITLDQARLVEIEVARLIDARARTLDAAEVARLDAEIARTIRLRERLGEPEFRLA